MYTARLREVKSGMVLAAPVSNLQGVLLLKNGTVLNEKNILMLKSWGVVEVSLEGEPQIENETYHFPDDRKKEIEKGLERRFYGTLDDDIMVEIMAVAAHLLHRRHLKEEEI